MSGSSSSQVSNALLAEESEPLPTQIGEPILLEAQESGSSSSSSPYGNLFLDNIDLFRQYSLDQGLVELYFNKGTSPQFIDLDLSAHASSSSSSSEGFLIVIDLEGDEGIFGEPYEFPEDLEFYFYDEKVDGSDSPGAFVAEKVLGENRVVVGFAPAHQSGTDHEFQINIEHPKLRPIRISFHFSEKIEYGHLATTTTRIKNSTGRLSAPYISSLISWINSFWAAYDASDASLIPELPRPPANTNTEFDPFAHARWKLRSDLGPLGILNEPTLTPGTGWKTVRGWNFLGVNASAWECITKPGQPGGLYSVYYAPGKEFDDWMAGTGRRPNQLDKSFDCRSFTAAAAYALKDQLASECEASIKYQMVGQDDNTHALLLVELQGCKTEPVDCGCCSGSFLYEPQSGATFKTVDEYCKKNPELCLDKSQWKGSEIEDADFGNLDWENDPAEMDRIKGVICGCLTGTYSPASAESMIKTKCQNATQFKNWFKSNFSFEPGKATSPMSDMPDILNCKRVVCEKGRSPELIGPMCTQEAAAGEQGITPYQCETQCEESWGCYEFECLAAYTLGGIVGEYEDKDSCLNVCSDDKVCVLTWSIRYDCESREWIILNDGNATRDCLARARFNTSGEWETVEEFGCNHRQFLLVRDVACDGATECQTLRYDDPSAPSELLTLPPEPSDCCGSWCELEEGNPSAYTGVCRDGTLENWSYYNRLDRASSFRFNTPCYLGDCQDKTRSIRFLD